MLPPAQLPDGSEIPLPPILLGKLGSDPQKKTVCIYGHLDVQPAALEDGWDSEPFTLVEREGEGTSACPPKGFLSKSDIFGRCYIWKITNILLGLSLSSTHLFYKNRI